MLEPARTTNTQAEHEVRNLYLNRDYPAMSHPRTDPAVTCVAARLAGLDAPDPSQSSILEIGCASGLNLLPLAARWPNAKLTGIDLSPRAIGEAASLAERCGLANVRFITTDLLDFDPGSHHRYDYIICHGIYSWVPESVREALPAFCAEHLSERGTAVISFNTLPGWSLRRSITELTARIAEGRGTGEFQPILTDLLIAAGTRTAYSRHLNEVLHDMIGHGEDFLAFDDFAPVNEPRSFFQFANHIRSGGLRYLGESLLCDDMPGTLPPESRETLRRLSDSPDLLQQTIDLLGNRTFRHALVSRSDAKITPRRQVAAILKCAARCVRQVDSSGTHGVVVRNHLGEVLHQADHPLETAFLQVLSRCDSMHRPFDEIIVHMAEFTATPVDLTRDLPSLAGIALRAARKSLITLRSEPLVIDPAIPDRPHLGSLRLACAEAGKPIVDPLHATCILDSPVKLRVAAAMDGSRTVVELENLARSIDPEFGFSGWIDRLARRGMFAW